MAKIRKEHIVSLAVFLYALVLYVFTVAPTASFWDAGEFIAIASGLQVSHPPGAPFYMLIGRLFSMFVPQPFIALSINMVSVLSSAVTILLMYWIIVRLVREIIPRSPEKGDSFSAMAGGVIGACAYAVSDSFWFNAVEAEVYAMSMVFTSLVVWLIMRWSDIARNDDHRGILGSRGNRILILVAYLFGLAIGAHLLCLLALFFIALIIYFTSDGKKSLRTRRIQEWDSRDQWLKIGLTLALASVAFLLVYPGIVQMLPKMADVGGNPLFLLCLIGLSVVGLVWHSHRRKWHITNMAAICLMMVLVGYSTYALIFIRSAADPPIDENDPENSAAIVSYLAREQYGETPLFHGPAFDDLTKQGSRTTKFLPRRYSSQQSHWNEYSRYDSDWEFFWKYQIGHMYVRYFLWNFSGRDSDIQNARSITGIPFFDGEDNTFFQTPSERASRNRYFALPLLLGLFGMLFHFRTDWRRAFSVLILFLVAGVGIILYLNQTPLQPRERDYSFVASFFAFGLWIGLGATGLIEMISEAVKESSRSVVSWIVAIVTFVMVPGIMLDQNYDDHDRSGRYVAPEYAANMLNSVDPNGIIFTNGDNDTFPLWYVQEVEGVRQDVRVTNLSLLNTPWYVHQLKNQWSRESAPLPISLSDAQIDNLTVTRFNPGTVRIPIDAELLQSESEVFSGRIDVSRFDSTMEWDLKGRVVGYGMNDEPISILYAADWAALNMIHTNAQQGWKRPIYFAVTVSPSGQLDMQKYFQMEGMAFRITPINYGSGSGGTDALMAAEVLSRFKFTNLDNPEVYYDENIRRMVDNYRNIFSQVAMAMIEEGMNDEAVELIDHILTSVPYETIPGDVSTFYLTSRVYQTAGRLDKAVEVLKKSEPYVLHYSNNSTNSLETRRIQLLAQEISRLYLRARDYEAYANFSNALNAMRGIDETMTPSEAQIMIEGIIQEIENDSAQVDTQDTVSTSE